MQSNWTAQWAESKLRVEKAVASLKNGDMIVVGDDGKRENEADLVFHASSATSEQVNFAITHARGLLCVSLGNTEAEQCGFYLASQYPNDISHTAFAQSVDARFDSGSGISARDRAKAIQLMGNPKVTPSEFLSPGHMFPVLAKKGGIVERPGHTEALQELCEFAGMRRSAAMCEILGENGDALKVSGEPSKILAGTPFEKLCYVTTVDILWYRALFFNKPHVADWMIQKSKVSLNLTDGTFNFKTKKSKIEENVNTLHDLCNLSSREGLEMQSEFAAESFEMLKLLREKFEENPIPWEKVTPTAHVEFLLAAVEKKSL